jgi:hypothetical protein
MIFDPARDLIYETWLAFDLVQPDDPRLSPKTRKAV